MSGVTNDNIKIRVNYGVTHNMGNYESLRLDYAAEIDIDKGAAEEGFKHLRIKLRKLVEAAIKEEEKMWR